MDYDIQRCTRHCSQTDRELSPGETYFSALVDEGAGIERRDYSKQAWQGPPEGTIAWWQAQIPDRKAKRANWAPNDVMLEFFDELAEQPQKQDMRYVLSLLLVRRRVMRHEETTHDDEQGREVLVLYCPRREATYEVPVADPDRPERIEEIQQELATLLE